MAKSKWQKILRYPDGSESVVIRGDKTLLEMIQENHWDPKYYHPATEQVLQQLNETRYEIRELGYFIGQGPAFMTYGQVGKRIIVTKEEILPGMPFQVITQENTIEKITQMFSFLNVKMFYVEQKRFARK